MKTFRVFAAPETGIQRAGVTMGTARGRDSSHARSQRDGFEMEFPKAHEGQAFKGTAAT